MAIIFHDCELINEKIGLAMKLFILCAPDKKTLLIFQNNSNSKSWTYNVVLDIQGPSQLLDKGPSFQIVRDYNFLILYALKDVKCTKNSIRKKEYE